MKNKVVLIIIFLIAAAFVIICFFSGIFDSEYALKIDDDTKVSYGEYMIYLYEQKNHFEQTGGADIWETDIDGVMAEDLAKQNAVDSIVDVKAAIKQADKLNIEFSDVDNSEIEKESNRFYNEIGEERAEKFGVSYDDIKQIIKEGYIRKKVFEYVTGGYNIDEREFEEYFEEYFEENKADLTDMKIKYIFKGFDKDKSNFNEVYTQMKEILSKAENGESFDSLIKEYSERNEYGEVQMKKGLFEQEVDNIVCSMKEIGEISGIITASNGFYIVYVAEVNPTDVSEIKKEERENYIKRKKEELYSQQRDKWLSSFSIEKNNEMFTQITIKDI